MTATALTSGFTELARVLKLVDQVIARPEGVVDGDHFHIWIWRSGPEHEHSDTTETIDTQLCQWFTERQHGHKVNERSVGPGIEGRKVPFRHLSIELVRQEIATVLVGLKPA